MNITLIRIILFGPMLQNVGGVLRILWLRLQWEVNIKNPNNDFDICFYNKVHSDNSIK